MRLLLQYLARRLLVSALCAATQTSLVDHEHRQLRIDAPAMTATADASEEPAATECVRVRHPAALDDTLSRASSKTLELADALQRFTGRDSADGNTSAPG